MLRSVRHLRQNVHTPEADGVVRLFRALMLSFPPRPTRPGICGNTQLVSHPDERPNQFSRETPPREFCPCLG